MRAGMVFFAAISACSNASSAPAPERIAVETIATPARAPIVVPAWGALANRDRIAAVHLVASVDGAIATDRPAYARADQHVEIHALIESGKHVFGDVSAAVLGGHAVHPEPLARAPRFSIAWNRVEPAAASYSNTEGGEFHFAAIDYQTTAIADAHEPTLAADVRPTLTTDYGHGVGTMRFQAVVTQSKSGERPARSPAEGGAEVDSTTIASAGPEARRGRGSGGLTDAVLRVTIRRDDTYLGYLTEMYGQPYIWASAGLSDATHQSERLEGSDCADFIVYGARRAGKNLAYTWTGGLPQITRLLSAGTRGDDGIYRDAAGKPLPFPKPGDLILFPRHVGALVEDRGTIGELDDQDLMVHSLFDTPKQQPIADSGYADKPVELRRFK